MNNNAEQLKLTDTDIKSKNSFEDKEKELNGLNEAGRRRTRDRATSKIWLSITTRFDSEDRDPEDR